MPSTIFPMLRISISSRSPMPVTIRGSRARCGFLEPVQDDAGDLVAIVFQHQHVAVADNTAVGEKAEVGLGAVPVEPGDDGAVDLARMVEVIGPGDDEDTLAGELPRIAHAYLTAVHVLPLKQNIGRDRVQARGIAGDPLAREISARTDELALPEIASGNHRRTLVDAHALTGCFGLDLSFGFRIYRRGVLDVTWGAGRNCRVSSRSKVSTINPVEPVGGRSSLGNRYPPPQPSPTRG